MQSLKTSLNLGDGAGFNIHQPYDFLIIKPANMKNDKLIYSIGSIVIIIAALMKIFNDQYADPILIFALIGMFVYQTWHAAQLKKRIREFETKL